MKWRPSERNDGISWISCSAASTLDTIDALPPPAGHHTSPPNAFPVRMSPRAFQLPPTAVKGSWQIVCGVPPSMPAFFRMPLAS